MLSREGCHLCAVALADVARICGELGVPWVEQDVDADTGLRAEYGDRVPVILIDDVEHGFWRVDQVRFRRALTEPPQEITGR